MRTVKLGAFTGEIGNIGKEEQVPQRQAVEGQRCPLRASTGSSPGVCNYLGCSPELCLSCSVQSLEQQNKVLTTRWNFLKDQDNSHSESDIKAIYEQYMNKMNQEMKALNYEQENLESELAKVLSTMDTFRSKYEDEIRLCSGMEFTFMELKKDLDVSTLHRTELEVKLKGLQELLELKKTIYEQELLTEIKDISVVLGIDSCSRPDLGRIVEDVRAQYEALALRSWEEAEALTRRKGGSFGGHLLDGRREIADLNIRIQKLRSCIVSQKSQCLYLEEHIREAGEQGEGTLRDAKAKVAGLEEALQRSREHMAHLVRDYQELMNIKLALDVEILTYRKLMEGEENRTPGGCGDIVEPRNALGWSTLSHPLSWTGERLEGV
uniref:Keratin 80 n=1 Tax=Cyanoderma ruficeps TaxID=181631 RepID=A0A8C3XBT2_9PASS